MDLSESNARSKPQEEHGPFPLGQLVQDTLDGALDPSAPCFTPYGSFWTVDVADTVARYSVQKDASFAVDPKTASLALIPFVITDSNFGLLRLESAQRGAFAHHTIESYEAVVETLGLAIAERRAQAALRERVKELTCLYSIVRIVEDSGANVDDALVRIVELLPPAWQFPDVAVARIALDGKLHATTAYETLDSRQVAKIVVSGENRGKVEVGYVREIPHTAGKPFLKEEQHLIDAVAREISEFVERRQAATQRLQLQAQLLHADRLATIGQLAAGVAHEINEPLSSILGFAQLARKDRDLADSTANDLSKIVAASLQAREIVNKLKVFARQAPIQKAWVSVADVVDDALSLVESRCLNQGVELVRRVASELREVYLDPGQLKQVVVNLSVNALHAMPDGGTLTVVMGRDDSCTIIEVQDTGIGMTDEVEGQIFNPFFTTKDVGEGTGLGLCVVQGIVTAHGGTIEVESEEGKGTNFTVRLPFSITPGTLQEYDLE
jgi:signal transduction histidine kinase